MIVRALLAMARKDLTLVLRDRSGFFFTFIFPIAFALFFGAIFAGMGGGGSGSGIKVVLIDDDRSEQSALLVSRLKAASELVVTERSDVAAAELDVVASRVAAMVRVLPGFGQGQLNLFFPGEVRSCIELAADPSKKAEVAMLQGILQKYTFAGVADSFTSPDGGRRQIEAARRSLGDSSLSESERQMFSTFFDASSRFFDQLDDGTLGIDGSAGRAASGSGFSFEPVKFQSRDLFRPRNRPVNSFAVTFPQGIIWGVMGAALGFAASLVAERSGGTYTRLRAGPLPAWGLLAGKAIACAVTMLAVTLAMLVVARYGCGVRFERPWVLYAAVFAVSLAFVGIMAAIASLARTERAASGIGWAVMMVFAFVGGAAVPSFAMPGWMNDLSRLSPMYWAIAALEAGLWRPLSGIDLLIPFAVLLSVAATGFCIGAWSMRRP